MQPPRGKAEVVRALLDAGASMLLEQGPNELSVRKVAARAKVNHGLIYRHFGKKNSFVRAIVEDLAQNLSVARSGGDLADTMDVLMNGRYYQVLARCLLDGMDMSQIQSQFPVMTQLGDEFQQLNQGGELRKDSSVEALLSMTVALGMGWALFEPFILSAMGVSGCQRERLRQEAMRMWQKILVS